MDEQKAFGFDSVKFVNRDTGEEVPFDGKVHLNPDGDSGKAKPLDTIIFPPVEVPAHSVMVKTTPGLLRTLGIPFRVLVRLVQQFRWN